MAAVDAASLDCSSLLHVADTLSDLQSMQLINAPPLTTRYPNYSIITPRPPSPPASFRLLPSPPASYYSFYSFYSYDKSISLIYPRRFGELNKSVLALDAGLCIDFINFLFYQWPLAPLSFF